MHSWGYLRDRCHHFGRNMIRELSRIISENEQTYEYNEETSNSEMKIKGRIVLDVWRLLRHEVFNILFMLLNLIQYQFFFFFCS